MGGRLRPPGWTDARAWLVSRRGERDCDDLLGIASGCPLSALRLGEGDALERFDRAAGLLQRAARPGAWVSSLGADVSDMDLRELLGWMQVSSWGSMTMRRCSGLSGSVVVTPRTCSRRNGSGAAPMLCETSPESSNISHSVPMSVAATISPLK